MSRLATRSRRNRFVILRTAGSPPVALHPASLRRSYLRFLGCDQPRHGLAPCRQSVIADALMAGGGRPSTSCDGRAKEDVDDGAKPRHDGRARPRFCVRRSDAAISIGVRNGMEIALSCPLSSSNPSLLHSNLRALDFPAAMIVQGRGRSTETS